MPRNPQSLQQPAYRIEQAPDDVRLHNARLAPTTRDANDILKRTHRVVDAAGNWVHRGPYLECQQVLRRLLSPQGSATSEPEVDHAS